MIPVKGLYQNLLTFYKACYSKYDLTNPFFCLNGNALTWNQYKPKEHFYSYEEYFHWVVNNSQYSLAVGEKILLQIYFEEIEGDILKGSLSFLPHPELMYSYFRFDLDKSNARNFIHNSYHIHFGYSSEDFRLTLFKFPYPSEFIKFVLFLMGHEEFTLHSKKKYFSDLGSLGESFSHFFDFMAH